MTKILLGDAVVFILFLISSARGWSIVKVIAAVAAVLISVFAILWLFLTRELMKRRSLWMVTAAVAILLCLLVSLILGYPCPAVTAAVAAAAAAA